MTNIGDLLGTQADKLAQDNINVGDVHFLNLDKRNGITPKNGDKNRDKYFVVLGFDEEGNIIGGVVINSNINYKLSSEITDYYLPIKVDQFPFLKYDSFVNCSNIIIAKRSKFNKDTYRGTISDVEIMEVIVNTLKESPTVNKKQLEEFGII